ncbi:MAG: putative sulfate exporter family transporter [Opitutae bacterium]|nr:putative sulfate exporter family transporter [Opitutae bacterium]
MADVPPTWKTPALWLCAGACALPWITPPVALFAGLVFAVFVGNTDAKRAAKVQKYLLQGSVVGLGFGIQFSAVVKAGSTGVMTTALTLAATMALGLALARWFAVERTTGQLISTGTAICGGSAIAAMGPVLGAEARVMSVALGCVFVLNAVALFAFPAIGHALGLTPEQFGYWAAIAIHDTSSVVGAAAKYSAASLAIAVPVKLARALWILPMVAVAAWFEKRRGAKAVVPWFVLLFIAASAVASAFPAGGQVYQFWVSAAKAGLAVTLFLIGASLSRDNLRSVGWRPFAMGISLWLVVSVVSLMLILRAA